jgi:glycine hydroxymethyltransferase
MAGRLQAGGYDLVSGGTSNHLCLVDLRPKGVDGARAERVMEMAHIAVNKNTVPGDTSALVPGGIRIGAPALTSRGFLEADFEKVADFLDRAVKIAQKVDSKSKGKKFKDFREALESHDWPEIAELRGDVAEFARGFPTVGFEKSEIM